jgi:hypothetical protein
VSGLWRRDRAATMSHRSSVLESYEYIGAVEPIRR